MSDAATKTDRLEFKYAGSNSGFCTTYFKRRQKLKNGTMHTFHYALVEGSGFHTATGQPWREPCSPVRLDILPRCFFERVPDDDRTSEYANAWLEENTGGLI